MSSPAVVVGVPVHGEVSKVVKGHPYRIVPDDLDQTNCRSLSDKASEKQVHQRVESAKSGVSLAQKFQHFPEKRGWQDVFWMFAFFVTLLILVVLCTLYSGNIGQARISSTTLSPEIEDATAEIEIPSVIEITIAGFVSAAASLVCAILFVNLARTRPACVVWTSLLFGPVMCIAMGCVLISMAVVLSNGVMLALLGFVIIAFGVCYLGCVLVCWKRLIPFMIVLLEALASVITQNMSMLVVSVIGSFVGIGWCMLTVIAYMGTMLEFNDVLASASKNAQNVILFFFGLFVIWGMLVANNICHVTYAGVFGRWFHGVEDGNKVRKSLATALTTSFGSICMGSFFIATVRALEMVVQHARRDAQSEGNTLTCVILCILEMIIGCIGDIMEYFSEWAYVQVAVRGTSFMNSVRITMGFCTCVNMIYIIKDLLLDSVVSLGALMCGICGAFVGAGFGVAFGGSIKIAICAIVGLLAGTVAGGSAVGVISSGVKTILVLWAEDPTGLEKVHPSVAAQLHSKMMEHW